MLPDTVMSCSNKSPFLSLLQNSFALGLSINSPDPMWSKTIEFSMVKPVAVENEGSNNQTLLLTPNSSSSCSIVNERNQTCHQFSLNCKLFHGMAIIIVKERFCIRSSVSRPLHCFPVLRAEEQPDIKVNINGLVYGNNVKF